MSVSWTSATAAARTGLYWHRRETQRLPVDPAGRVDPDLLVAVAAWLLWDSNQPSLVRIPAGDRPPRRLPEDITVYDRQLLDPFFGDRPAGALSPAWSETVLWTRPLALATQLAAHIRATPPPEQVVVTPGTVGIGGRAAACPVCGREDDLAWVWDGLVVRGRCPDGHGDWTPRPYLTAAEWSQFPGAAIATA